MVGGASGVSQWPCGIFSKLAGPWGPRATLLPPRISSMSVSGRLLLGRVCEPDPWGAAPQGHWGPTSCVGNTGQFPTANQEKVCPVYLCRWQ